MSRYSEKAVHAEPTAHWSSRCGSMCGRTWKYSPSSLRRQTYLWAVSKTTDWPWSPTDNELVPQRLWWLTQSSFPRMWLFRSPDAGSAWACCCLGRVAGTPLVWGVSSWEICLAWLQSSRKRERGEQEIEWWSNSRACQREMCQGDTCLKMMYHLPYHWQRGRPERWGELADSPSLALCVNPFPTDFVSPYAPWEIGLRHWKLKRGKWGSVGRLV